ncbi:carboxymuconolactone decarboxylase family protein [Croceibacterium ferulae]|uniref:carboxymuconolactone decarboxylase family protein n=1 Tax=Croceibacterium ferulae TaxID=1854641 RepID=UPI000EAE80CC|nr:carboxymuconolactone decarboxylase family protein [Croceibacterium ferulae]
MTPRIDNPQNLFPAGLKAMVALETALHQTGLDPVLLELVKLRASQINGCAHCIHMHTTALRRRGVEEMKLYLLTAWRESSLFTPRERAAIGWAEALTRVAETGAPDAEYTDLAFEFTEEEQVQLTYAIGAINVWNRLQVGFRTGHPVDAREAA